MPYYLSTLPNLPELIHYFQRLLYTANIIIPEHNTVMPVKNFLTQRSLKALAIEMLSIVAAVLIALAVSEWNKNRNHQQNVKAAMVKITSEMGKNIKLLETVHANNQKIVDMQKDGDTRKAGVFRPALQILDTAWKTAMSTGTAEHMTYDQLYTLSEVYALQGLYRSYTNQLIQAMMQTTSMAIAMNPDIKSDADMPSGAFDQYLSFVVLLEAAVLKTHKETHAELKKKGY